MRPGFSSWVSSLGAWEKCALALWSLIVLGVGLRVAIQPQERTVYPIFSSSARLWWSGAEVYPPNRPADMPTGFRYSPTIAILTSPFALLPDDLGGVLWRWLSVGVYLASLAWWARVALPATVTRMQLALLLLFVIPLSLPSVNNGQANVLIIGLLLATTAAAAQQRWNLCAVCVGLAFICKIYPLALGLLLAVLYPRQLIGRLLLVVSVLLALPFLCQEPGYVLDQYGKWIASLGTDDRSTINLDSAYRDLWLLVRQYHVPVSRQVYEVLQVCSGGLLALVCWYRQRHGWSERQLLTETLALGTGWMLLLGPATESCTYILMAPSLAWAGLSSLQPPRRILPLTLVLTCSAMFLANFLMSWLPDATRLHARGLHVWATVVWMVFLALQRPIAATREKCEVHTLSESRAA